MKTSQFWLIYIMASLSVTQGYYTVTVFKQFGQTEPVLNDDSFLCTVGSVGFIMGIIRFFWSAALDLKSCSFMIVYTVLLCLQIAMSFTIHLAVQTRTTYALWIALMIFTEGGHFTLVPNVLRIIFGEKSASIIYGVVFSFTGVAQIIIISIVLSKFG